MMSRMREGGLALLLLVVPIVLCAQTRRVGTRSAAPVENDPGPGIAESLAQERAARLSDLRYDLELSVPAEAARPVTGRVTMHMVVTAAVRPLVIDFAPAASATREVRANGTAVAWRAVNGHLVLPAAAIRSGPNDVEISFVAGDAPLNRNPDFLYTLFVPARAHHAFPCFDQPSLKARYRLRLEIPAAWQVVANGAETERRVDGDRVSVTFAETPPLSTYLFAFAAGNFRVETAERDGRTLRMFHRETDAAKVARNRDAIFDLHAKALAAMAAYTAAPYAWGKFDFVLIPSFQFGGMEHAGAILYNASGLLLEESATINQQLNRALTIAHETAHMWFGDLVTMRWFDDVWLKEVFANVMAAKIVNPSFPQINHELRFLFAHYPAAYSVDRTAGANAIHQRLANLDEAGTLYGDIIYNKAPIVMRNLERLIGPETFRDGLREYLTRYRFGNATWNDLVAILDARTDEDLRSWSHAWVDEAGRPTIRTRIRTARGRLVSLTFDQADARRRGLRWIQELAVAVGYPDREETVPVRLAGGEGSAAVGGGRPAPSYVLANGQGLAYGQIELDGASRTYLLAHLPEIRDPLTRGSAWVTLWDEMLRGVVSPAAFAELALRALETERDELNVQQVLAYLRETYWRFLPADARLAFAVRLEPALRHGLETAAGTSLKSAWFQAFRDTALTGDGIAWLERVWRRQETVPGLTFSEVDEIQMAMELAVREVPDWRQVLSVQFERTTNPDRKARFAFVRPALDADPAVREQFFQGLRDVRNRAHEAWVIEGVSYLHHALRAASAERDVRPSLELLQEIQRTGDIFFPKRWMDATLHGHNSSAAARTVRTFLHTLPPSYPPRLRMTIASAADELLRAERILGRTAPPFSSTSPAGSRK